MAFYRTSGPANIQMFNGAASTVLSAGGAVVMTSGALAKASSTDLNILGICQETRATTDGDYATARPVMIDVLIPGDLVLCDNVTGTLTAAMQGRYQDLSSTAGLVLDAGTDSATEGNFMLVQFISATQGIFALAGSALTRPSA